jgi:hypothetical protein
MAIWNFWSFGTFTEKSGNTVFNRYIHTCTRTVPNPKAKGSKMGFSVKKKQKEKSAVFHEKGVS